MMDSFLIIACLYFAYNNVKMLMEVPIAQWQLVQWVMALTTVALLVTAALKGVQVARKKKEKDAEEANALPKVIDDEYDPYDDVPVDERVEEWANFDEDEAKPAGIEMPPAPEHDTESDKKTT